MVRLTPLFAVLLVSLSTVLADETQYVWWEGEKPESTNFPDSSWFKPQNDGERAILSEGDWLTIDGKPTQGDQPTATYKVYVPEDGDYHLWTRKFWYHGPFAWRFDDRPWQTCGKDIALADEATLRTHVVANWVRLGKVTLTRGHHIFELRLVQDNPDKFVACFDAFVLSQAPFFPNGKLKPGEKTGLAEPGYFAYEPQPDPFMDDAPLDLRYLNETVAGQNGYVTRQGNQFKLGNNDVVRFWAVNVSSAIAAQDHDTLDYMARRLAKLGVNMVRFHSPLFDPNDLDKIDPRKLDNLFYLVTALKKQGIYTTLSFYFPLWVNVKPEYGIEGYDTIENKHPFGLIYFNERLQSAHRAWMKQLLTTPNPYTGVTLSDDPALAVVELVNEDSLFFWTFSHTNIPDAQWQKINKLFGDDLTLKYGSVAKALEAWGPGSVNPGHDDPDQGKAEVSEDRHKTRGSLAKSNDALRNRMRDQVRFLTQLQHGFYESASKYLRDELNFRGLINCSNWQTSDPSLYDALERYTYTAGDVIDQHGYFQGKHTGEGHDYSVRVGHWYLNRSALKVPWASPIAARQVVGYPQIISEIGYPLPNRNRAEMTLMAAIYGRLQGIDGLYFFALDSATLTPGSIGKFQITDPVVLQSFPACALIYRRGDLDETGTAVGEGLTPGDLFNLKGNAVALASDEKKPDFDARTFPALAYFVGPVQRTFVSTAFTDRTRPFIKTDKRTVTDPLSQVTLDYGRGLLTLNTPRTRAAVGSKGEMADLDLSGVKIKSGNDYSAVVVTSLTPDPIATSRRVLIQALTTDKPYGFKTQTETIESLGQTPWLIEQTDLTVVLPWGMTDRVFGYALNENGTPRPRARNNENGEDVTIDQERGFVRVKLPRNATHVVVEQ
ncbi:MAG: hypothetical protein GC164_10795 [Phycisphaera sp.]|nr:hypothetical protein [Phycisphaera sp.]